jgi:cobalamin biosynthesis protein CbiG
VTLVLGLGASTRADLAELDALIGETLAAHGLDREDVTLVASLDARRTVLAPLCDRYGWQLVTHAAADLAAQEVQVPSDRAQRAVGTPSVAEAAARLHGELLVGKTSSAHATLAVARLTAP